MQSGQDCHLNLDLSLLWLPTARRRMFRGPFKSVGGKASIGQAYIDFQKLFAFLPFVVEERFVGDYTCRGNTSESATCHNAICISLPVVDTPKILFYPTECILQDVHLRHIGPNEIRSVDVIGSENLPIILRFDTKCGQVSLRLL